jgi:site-specific DNA-methyltransferase (adenine-specific)
MINTILNIYCLEGFKLFGDSSVDMLLSDWPYGITDNNWDVKLPLDEVWPEIKRVVKPNGAILLFAQSKFDKILGASNINMYRYDWVWIKSNGTNFFNAKRHPLKVTENILCFYQKQPVYNPQFSTGKPYTKVKENLYNKNCDHLFKGYTNINQGLRYPVNSLYYNTVNNGNLKSNLKSKEYLGHPTQKPVDLCEYLIKTYTNPGDIVLDNCAGTGTTAVAAIRTGRKFLAFEKDPGFFEIAKNRINQELLQPCLITADGVNNESKL